MFLFRPPPQIGTLNCWIGAWDDAEIHPTNQKKKALVIRGKVSETGKSILQKIAFALVQEEEFVFNEIQVNILILADLTTIFIILFATLSNYVLPTNRNTQSYLMDN